VDFLIAGPKKRSRIVPLVYVIGNMNGGMRFAYSALRATGYLTE
jgi:hypothetical protein